MTSKRNTVSILLELDDYTALSELAKEQDRTNAGQARHMLRLRLQAIKAGPERAPPFRPGDSDAAGAGNAPEDTVVTVLKDGKQEPLSG